MKKDDLIKLKAKLPKIPGIFGKDKYFNAAVLIPLVMIDGEYHFLFQERAAHIRQEGEVCFPGGEHEPRNDATCEETAIRETVEELGVDREKIKIEGAMDTLVIPSGTTVDSFIARLEITELDELKIDKKEVARVFTLPVAWFEKHEPKKYKVRVIVEPSYMNEEGEKIDLLPTKELDLPEIYSRPWGGREYRVLVYQTKADIVWGITAELVYGMIKKIR